MSEENIYQAPEADLGNEEVVQYTYAGFWVRVVAAIIDSILTMFVLAPILYAVYGPDYWSSDRMVQGSLDVLISYVLPAIAVILFWFYKSATPGKMAWGLKVVDARTHGKPALVNLVVRYIGYYVATIPLGIGIIWVAFDKKKQGWHDKMAGTVVVKSSH